MLQLMFDFENDSEADAKTAMSLAPAAIAASKPYKSWSDMSEKSHDESLVVLLEITYF